MGGGTCVNGNWLPPGMGATRRHASFDSCHRRRAGRDAVQSSNCPGADPFAIMGGGTCYNGNWLPPGIAPPAGSTPPPSPPPPSQPRSAVAPRSLVTWQCINNGWVPPGYPGTVLPLCTSGTPPVAGWVRDAAGNWLPPDHPKASTAVCRG